MMSPQAKGREGLELLRTARLLSHVSTRALRAGVVRFLAGVRETNLRLMKETAGLNGFIRPRLKLRDKSVEQVLVLDRLVFVVMGGRGAGTRWGHVTTWMPPSARKLTFPLYWDRNNSVLSIGRFPTRWDMYAREVPILQGNNNNPSLRPGKKGSSGQVRKIRVFPAVTGEEALREFDLFARHFKRRSFSGEPPRHGVRHASTARDDCDPNGAPVSAWDVNGPSLTTYSHDAKDRLVQEARSGSRPHTYSCLYDATRTTTVVWDRDEYSRGRA